MSGRSCPVCPEPTGQTGRRPGDHRLCRYCSCGLRFVADGRRFDAVIAFEVPVHRGGPVGFLRVCGSLLRPGASLFRTVPGWSCAAVQRAEMRDRLPSVQVRLFTGAGLFGAAEAAVPARRRMGATRKEDGSRGRGENGSGTGCVADRGFGATTGRGLGFMPVVERSGRSGEA